MNILFTRFPLESANGGAEKQTISLMQGLSRRGHEVSFLGSCPVMLAECKRLKIVNEQLKIGNPPVTKWAAISFLWRKYGIRKKLINHFQFSIFNFQLDAVVMLSLSEKILLTPYALKQGINVVWVEHDTVGPWLTKNPWLPTLRKLSAHVTTVCVSELSAQIFRGLRYENVVAIPNGVDAPPKTFRSHIFDETLRVGCIARLSPEKGVDILVEAMRSVCDATLLINGKGPQYIQQSQRVSIRAEVPDIDDIYKEIDVLVLPSRQEDPFGMVVAEAMLRGIAVICTDACGVAGYLTDGKDALIVPSGNASALTQAIIRMANGESRMAIARAGKKTAEEKFTVEKMVEEYVRVIGEQKAGIGNLK